MKQQQHVTCSVVTDVHVSKRKKLNLLAEGVAGFTQSDCCRDTGDLCGFAVASSCFLSSLLCVISSRYCVVTLICTLIMFYFSRPKSCAWSCKNGEKKKHE
jgi:hypothetical protein